MQLPGRVGEFSERINEGLVSLCGGSTRLDMLSRCGWMGESSGGSQPWLKLRRQRVKGTSPLVYSDSYHSLSFVCQCRGPVTAVPLTSFIWWPLWTLELGPQINLQRYFCLSLVDSSVWFKVQGRNSCHSLHIGYSTQYTGGWHCVPSVLRCTIRTEIIKNRKPVQRQ